MRETQKTEAQETLNPSSAIAGLVSPKTINIVMTSFHYHIL